MFHDRSWLDWPFLDGHHRAMARDIEAWCERELGHEHDADTDTACRDLVRRALTRFRLPYITITPTFSVCPTHGYLEGEHAFCPRCDEERLSQKRLAAA